MDNYGSACIPVAVSFLLRCALATMRLGYEVFAIRQMGLCATSKDAYGRHVRGASLEFHESTRPQEMSGTHGWEAAVRLPDSSRTHTACSAQL